MIIQSTLVTCHKGVDLHAETAGRVIRQRISGGERLRRLSRAEFHTFWRDTDQAPPESIERLLEIGRFYNPNKHRYGHFESPQADGPWFAGGFRCEGEALPAGWPGEVVATDWPGGETPLFERLAGGPAGEGTTHVDACAFTAGDPGPLLSGVFWRLVLDPGEEPAADLARRLIVAGGPDSGLLVNPHLHGWLIAGA